MMAARSLANKLLVRIVGSPQTLCTGKFRIVRPALLRSAYHRSLCSLAFGKIQSLPRLLDIINRLTIASANQSSCSETPNFDSNSITMDEIVVEHVCNVNDLKDGEMKEVVVGTGKALLIRQNGEYSAIGHRCTHNGAQLVKGSLRNGKVRCPWHGACFDAKTGDIEDYPGLDCVSKHDVVLDGEKVVIHAKKSAVTAGINKRCRLPTSGPVCTDGPQVLIIGGGPASLMCAEILRQSSFAGKITIATKESHLPYDRTKLSKQMDTEPAKFYLRKQEFFDAAKIDVLRNKEACAVDLVNQQVSFTAGGNIGYDKLVIATGGKPRQLSVPGCDLKNVFVLRTPEDANAIAKIANNKHVLICGASFIALEVASTLHTKAKKITVCHFSSVPFARVFGKKIGEYIMEAHKAKGIEFLTSTNLEKLEGRKGEVERAVLSNGEVIPADIVVAGIGILPQTSFLRETNISLTEQGYVDTDQHLQVLNKDKEIIPNVFAAGDIAMYSQSLRGWTDRSNVQHYQMAHYHGRTVGLNLLAKPGSALKPVQSVPFFWTKQYGIIVRYCGHGQGFDDIVLKAEPNMSKFIAYYTKGGAVLAVATMGNDPYAAECAQRMLDGTMPTKQEIQNEIGNGSAVH